MLYQVNKGLNDQIQERINGNCRQLYPVLIVWGGVHMKCPYCEHLDNRVIDSRLNKDATITRRRRECLACDQRFTTYERLEVMLPVLVKKDGRREGGIDTSLLPDLKKHVKKDL